MGCMSNDTRPARAPRARAATHKLAHQPPLSDRSHNANWAETGRAGGKSCRACNRCAAVSISSRRRTCAWFARSPHAFNEHDPGPDPCERIFLDAALNPVCERQYQPCGSRVELEQMAIFLEHHKPGAGSRPGEKGKPH